MKIKILLFTFISLFLGSCTLTKRYHSIGYQVDWKSNKNTINQAKKSNLITVNKSTTPLLANKSLGEITNSESELSPITKSDVQQSLPIEQNSIGKSPRAIKSIFHKAQPSDSIKIQKIAVLKQKTKNRFKNLGFTTLFSILTLAIINILDGDNSGCPPFSMWCFESSGAFLAAALIFGLIWYLLFFIAVITWIVYQLSKFIRKQGHNNRPGFIGLRLLILGVSLGLIGFAMWSLVLVSLAALLVLLSLIFFLIALFKAIGRRK
jgi:hypothetical protein